MTDRVVFDYVMRDGAPVSLAGVRGCRIHCHSGAVLLTAYGDHADHQLAAGSHYTAANNGLLLIESLAGSSRLVFEIPLPRVLRLWRALGWPERYAPHRGIRNMVRLGALRQSHFSM